MQHDFVDSLARYLTIAVIAVIVIVGFVIGCPQLRSNSSLRAQEAELDARIEMKKAEIARLTENQRRFGSDTDFLERIARQNRRVFPGEFVFVFESDK